MGLHKLPKEKKCKYIDDLSNEIICGLDTNEFKDILKYASDKDNQVRKFASSVLADAFKDDSLKDSLSKAFETMIHSDDEKIRQTAIYTAGQIGQTDAEEIYPLLEIGIADKHFKVQKATTSVLKVMCEKNPEQSLDFIKKHVHHENPSVRREIVHGIELRGKKCPEDILPVLRSLQDEKHKSVVNIVIHVIGQISYKKGAIESIATELKTWNNKWLVKKSVKEIISVHKKHPKITDKSLDEIENYLILNKLYEK